MTKTDFTPTTGTATDTSAPLVFSGASQTVTVPNPEFIADSDMTRDGQDLILTLENGESLVIEGYFAADMPPTILSESGSALTPQLVNSFVHNPVFAAAGGVTDASPIGAVKEISGDATITRADGSVEQMTLGTPVYEGDVIETGEDGAVNILFIDETEFAVSESARLAIDEYVFDPATSEGSTNFSVLRGVFVFTSGLIGRDDPDDVEIDTPVGSIGIRGTIIAGKIDAEGGDNQITVVEGAIVVKNALGEVTLSTQFETVKLGGYNSEITNIGTLDAGQMNDSFGGVSGVSGSLFSAINDTSSDRGPDSHGKEHAPGQQNKASDAPDGADGADQPSATSEDAPDADAGGTTDQAAPAAAAGTTTTTTSTTSSSGLESTLTTSDSGLNTSGTGDSLGTTSLSSDTKIVTTTTAPTTTVKSTTTLEPVTTTYEPLSPIVTGGTTGTSTGSTTTAGSSGLVLDLGTMTSVHGLTLNMNGFGIFADAEIGGHIVALGDIDGNGKDDFAFTGTNGKLFTFKSGSISSYTLSGAISGDTSDVSISAGGDLNGDGNLDLVIGTPQADGVDIYSGQAGVFSANSLSLHQTITSDTASIAPSFSELGRDVAFIGDRNGDGFTDYALSVNDFGGSGEGGILLHSGMTSVLSTAHDTADYVYITGAAAGDDFGYRIDSAGDLNNDGFADLIVGSKANTAYILWGGHALTSGTIYAQSGSAYTTLVGGSGFGEEVIGGGDVNRDGFSDLIISSQGAYGDQAHLYLGGAGAPTQVATFYTSRAGWEVSGGSFLGDFNGDGIDDFVLSTSDGANNHNIFVFYGQQSGLSGTFDLNFADLTAFDPTKGFAMKWSGVGGHITLSDLGDINGDGLDDLGVGASDANLDGDAANDGSIKVVYGHASVSVVRDGDVRDADLSAGNIKASASGQALLGTDGANIIDGGLNGNISVSAGAGNDIIKLYAAGVTHKTIDGGGGYDTLQLSGTNGVLDFTTVGAANSGMTLSNIEEIQLNGENQTLKLTTADIFTLLQESSNNSLKITAGAGATGSSLQVFEGGASVNLSSQGFSGELGTDSNANGYYDLTFGNYTLYIDTNINVSLV
ncbi:MAG: FG-GAP repeat protein [Rhodospirillales bacterium]|nr:FG-GAP repeat protein [Rhodospirillales bacterium]